MRFRPTRPASAGMCLRPGRHPSRHIACPRAAARPSQRSTRTTGPRPHVRLSSVSLALPACRRAAIATKCLRIVNEKGVPITASKHPPLSPSTDDWKPEQALDVDMISAACPKCKIILVEANSTAFTDLGAGVDTAVKLGAAAVSNSYGAPSPAAIPRPTRALRSSGPRDRGQRRRQRRRTAQQRRTGPSVHAFATVVCVGGTHRAGRQQVERDRVEYAQAQRLRRSVRCNRQRLQHRRSKPSFESDTGCKMRSAADIAAVADVTTPVWLYVTDTQVPGHWAGYGSTSASSRLSPVRSGSPETPRALASPPAFGTTAGRRSST